MTVLHDVSNKVRSLDTEVRHEGEEDVLVTGVPCAVEDGKSILDKNENSMDKKTFTTTTCSTIKISGAYCGSNESISWFSDSNTSSSSSSNSSSSSGTSGCLHKNSTVVKPQGDIPVDFGCVRSIQDEDEHDKNNRVESKIAKASSSASSTSTWTLTSSSSLPARAEEGCTIRVAPNENRGRFASGIGSEVGRIENHSGKKRGQVEKAKESKRMKEMVKPSDRSLY